MTNNTPTRGQVEITDMAFAIDLGQSAALKELLEDLDQSGVSAAGITYAKAVVEKHIAQVKSSQSMRAIRLAAKHFADLSTVNVSTQYKNGVLVLSWMPSGDEP